MGKNGLTRRGLPAGLAAAVVSSGTAGSAFGDATWAMLVQELQAAEQAHRAAMTGLAEAERHLFVRPARRRKRKQPNSYLEAQGAEVAAGQLVEALHRRMVKTPARSREGLLTKIRLIANAYGIDSDARVIRLGEDGDLMSCLIRSLIVDLSMDEPT